MLMPGDLIVGFGPGDENDLAGVPFDGGGGVAARPGNILQMSLQVPRRHERQMAQLHRLASICQVLCVVGHALERLTAQPIGVRARYSAAVGAWATRTMHLFRVASGSASGFTMMSPPASDSNATWSFISRGRLHSMLCAPSSSSGSAALVAWQSTSIVQSSHMSKTSSA